MADLSQIKVEKKDGRQEAYLREKLTGGMIKAGATPEQADLIAAQMEEWIATTAQNGVIKTADIRTKLLELLSGVNPVAAENFKNYSKTTTAAPAMASAPVPATTPSTLPEPVVPESPAVAMPTPAPIDEVTSPIPEPTAPVTTPTDLPPAPAAPASTVPE